MKIKLLLALCATYASVQAFCTFNKTPYLGSVHYPASFKSIPSFCGYFRGTRFSIKPDKETERSNASFTILSDTQCDSLNILLTQRVIPTGDKQHIQSLKVPKEQSYKLFSLQKKAVKSSPESLLENSYTWEIIQKKLDNRREIDENTIIILIEPQFIEELRPITWSTQDFVTKLPPIKIINDQALEKKICHSATTLRLAALDLDAIHEKVEHETRKINHIIAMQPR